MIPELGRAAVLLGLAAPWRCHPVTHALVRTADFLAGAIRQGELCLDDLLAVWPVAVGNEGPIAVLRRGLARVGVRAEPLCWTAMGGACRP